ncbi:uracil-DNA glycosylase [Thiobacillus sp. 65-1402]|uniref:uracil-DNA glycosylase n=1 Tax=Thiobacillus sp. 65-1402 TaxID=1895861 RepID=UPI00095A265D|nr:uracil-DNA glycosylase [Thiobacillus sp. 65-1402]OJW77957.1 MAG: uracil-DNA glycosylase [Thiobacillus sp. 65-1402]
MLSRADVFDELGIGPVWRLREAPVAQAAAAPVRPRLNWEELADAVAHCTACKLHLTRTQGVLGVGDRNADWLIIGEAPGADEDRLGEPFVGQAGKLLDAMLAAISLQRGDNVYIANLLKSRPPGNRNPEPDEVAACRPYLLAQIELIQPKLILALGRFAAQNLLDTDEAIGRLRGRVHRFQGVPLVVTYHPAYLLRNLADKARAWEDLCLARRTYATLTPDS